jgi:hypothetical protein
MNESFIHYVWQCQYFSKVDLYANTGEAVHIFHPGTRNTNAGPDFLNARIRVGDIQWIGNVEIHIDSSGWLHHSHQDDESYDNVILHVVWRNDVAIKRRDGSLLPAIEIGNRVEEQLLTRYRHLFNSVDVIPCTDAIPRVKPVTVFSTVDSMSLARLQAKAEDVLLHLERNRGNWSETCYQLLSRNYGFKVNAEPFHQLSTAIPFKTLLKHADKPLQVEAMLFGVAGFMDDDNEEDNYFQTLKREYNLLRQKYRLDHKAMKKIQWKFLRLRPANFPTLRIAQFAAAIGTGKDFFPAFLELPASEIAAMFSCAPSEYWQRHFHFGKPSAEKNCVMGESSTGNILINTVAPVLAAYSIYKDEGRCMDKAIDILHSLPAENNNIIAMWARLSMPARDAFDSQGLLELYNHYCTRRRCLDCNIGASLVKPNKT